MEKEEIKNKEQNNTEEVIKDKSEIKNSEEKEVKKQQTPAEKIKDLEDKVTRTYADMENQRRRYEKEKEEAFEYGGFSFARESLNLIDNLERSKVALQNDNELKNTEALKKIIEHLEIINKDMLSILKKNNIEVIKSINEKLDPNFHQAMMEVEDDAKDPGTIVQEIQKGFMMKDRLLRPSLVAVSKKKVEEKQNNQKDKKIEEKETKN
jgi:molecular chaperone GrpE